MAHYENYLDVLTLLQSEGLNVTHLDLGKIYRVSLSEGRRNQKKGWYFLNEVSIDSKSYLVGCYGIWMGQEHHTQRVDLKKALSDSLTPDQRQAMKDSYIAAKKKAEAEEKARQDRAADLAIAKWAELSTEGECSYLAQKQIKPSAKIRYGNASVFIEYERQNGDGVISYNTADTLVVPMFDSKCRLRGLQFILGKGNDKYKAGQNKMFWPKNIGMAGTYSLLGPLPRDVILICEGYATGESLAEATGLAVVVAWNANNLQVVAKVIKKLYKNARILVCADDDFVQECAGCGKYTPVSTQLCGHCNQPHKKGNAGVSCAQAAAMSVGGAWLKPEFENRPTDKKSLTDFNDLHVSSTLALVAQQINAKIEGLGWKVAAPPAPVSFKGEGEDRPSAVASLTLDELVDRFVYIDDDLGKSVFDTWTHKIVDMNKMRSLLPGKCRIDDIKSHPVWNSRAYYLDQIGFDPDGSQPEVVCNLYSGWPTKPKAGSTEAIEELLQRLCSNENKLQHELYAWLLNWLAFPIQNPGAKMQTAVIMHGDQGGGKNTFFSRVYRPIYGRYGVEFGQTSMEEKYNGWMSGMLFAIGNEVIASRDDLYHVKGKIKNMITEPFWQIRSMHQDARLERNCCNFVFFSNALNPMSLEVMDRRFCVIWTPPTPRVGDFGFDKFRDLLRRVNEEIDNGGVAAFHDLLLKRDLGSFSVNTEPPMTEAKSNVIDLNLESKDRFYYEWINGEIGNVPLDPVSIELLYEFYRKWCDRRGIKSPSPMHVFRATLYSKPHVQKKQERVGASRDDKRTMVFVTGVVEPPPGVTKSRPLWLLECEENFIDKTEAWIDMLNNNRKRAAA